MKFGNKTKNEKVDDNKKNEEIQIIMGDDSELEISDVGDCMNKLRPKVNEQHKKTVVIPKIKKKQVTKMRDAVPHFLFI